MGILGRIFRAGSGDRRDDDLREDNIETLRAGGPVASSGGDADAGDSKSTQVDPYGVDRAGVDRGESGGFSGDTDAGDSNTLQADPHGSDPEGSDRRG